VFGATAKAKNKFLLSVFFYFVSYIFVFVFDALRTVGLFVMTSHMIAVLVACERIIISCLVTF